MTTYRVRFLKTLLSSDGHPFECLQREMCIHDAATPTQAAERAEREFLQASHASDWRHQADTMEIVEQALEEQGFEPNSGPAPARAGEKVPRAA